MTYKIFHNKRRIICMILGVILILLGFILIGSPFSMTLLFIGAVLACYNRLPERQAVSRLIKAYAHDYPSMEYTFTPEGIHIVTTRQEETTTNDMPYTDIIRLVKTPSYNFMFNKKRAGCILDLRGFQPADVERLEHYIAEHTGLTWEPQQSPFRKKGL